MNLPIPTMLGAGYRAPGFDPYLEFLRDTVFLKYKWRAYRDPGEKVCQGDLKVRIRINY